MSHQVNNHQENRNRGMRWFGSFTLRTKLIIAFLIVALLPLGILIAINFSITQQALIDQANLTLLSQAKQTATEIDSFITANLATVRTEAGLSVLREYLSLSPEQRAGSAQEKEALAILNTLNQNNPVFIASYALLDSRGLNVIDTNKLDIGLDESHFNHFQKPFNTGLSFVSPVHIYGPTKTFSLFFSHPVFDPEGKALGVLRIRYRAAVLQQIITRGNNLAGPRSFAILLDENHIRLAHGTKPDFIFKTVVPLEPTRLAELKRGGRLPDLPPEQLSTTLPDFEAGLDTVGTDKPFFTTQLVAVGDESNSVAVTSLNTQLPWLVVFAQPQAEFLTLIQTQTQITLTLVAITALVIIGIAFVFGQFLAGPIVRLTTVVGQITEGDLETQAQVESQDEIGQLATAFNTMTTQLRDFIGSLENQVRERTTELAFSMEVGQQASAIKDLDELLPTIVESIRERFDLYYIQIYFIDTIGQDLVLKSSTGTMGKELLAHGHRLPIDSSFIIGLVAIEGNPVVVSDVDNSDIYKPNSLLPKTRSELVLPLIIKGQVIGVLDMHADQTNTFTKNNLTVFEAMTIQLAISIDSARQWASVQTAQQRSEEIIQRYLKTAWESFLPTQAQTYFEEGVVASNTENEKSILQIPLSIRGQVVGHLGVDAPPYAETWTKNDIALIETVSEQVGLTIENLRLFDETQQRATREQLARQITDKIQGSRDIESALRTAAQELSKALDTTRAVVDLKVAESGEAGDE